jgi:hypothetical protein
MSRDVRAIVLLHAALFAGTAVVAVLDAPEKGWAVVALVVAYNVALPLTARSVGRRDWFALWAFLLPVSIFQIVPDWILVDVVGILHFPDNGGPRLDDSIALAMGGMWVAPLFIALALARGRAALAAALSLGVFLGSELLAPVIGLWEPVGDTEQWAGVAVYVLPAEAALGWAAATAFALAGKAPLPRRVLAAFAVSTFYTGALVVSHFLIDVAGWRITT